MLDRVLKSIAPHYCYGCGVCGTVLCDCCKNYIQDDPFLGCVVCGASLTSHDNLCSHHQLPYQRLWCIAKRKGALEKLIDAYKFERAVAVADKLAELLDESLPDLPKNTVLVPIPTAPRNIRLRGYDHMLKIAKILAKKRSWRVERSLARRNNVTQHFAKNATKRRQQAETFFRVKRQVDPSVPYLIIDDIFTTGSTVKASADCLKRAGAVDIWVAVIARQ